MDSSSQAGEVTGIGRAAALALLALLATGGARSAEPVHFPPYPDKWEWFVPVDEGTQLTDLSASLLRTGDVMVSAEFTDRAGKRRKNSWSLFTQKPLDALAIARREEVVGDPRIESSLGSGFTVTNLPRNYRLCFRGPVRNVIAKRDKLGHSVAERVFFVVLDQPRTFVGGGGQQWFGDENASCPDEGPVRVTYRVMTLAGPFLSLPDGTTLLIDPAAGLILRLRDTLQAGAPSASGRVFGFDYDDDDFFIDNLLGKHYQQGDETPRYQEMLDDLHRYLTRRKPEH